MNINEDLEIILITYNRKSKLIETFNQILAPNSPIANLQITILDNKSSDGSSEIIDSYCQKYSNLKHIRHNRNINGCGNIARAFEIATKKYLWILCDDDTFDWTGWNEIKNALEKDYDIVFTRKCNGSVSDIFYQSTFVPACIYKTANITDTVMANIYDYIKSLFPHLAIVAKNINDNKKMYFPAANIVDIGVNQDGQGTFTRGYELKDVPKSRRHIFWTVGYFASLELIYDKKNKRKIIEDLRYNHKSLYQLFKTVLIINKYIMENDFDNLYIIFKHLTLIQKCKFIIAYLSVQLSMKDSRFLVLNGNEKWQKYFIAVNEQKYIDKIAKKFKNKKIMLYGAGIVAQELLKNYDMSKLNIVGISDKKYIKNSSEDFYSIKTINPEKLSEEDFDVILFTMHKFKNIETDLKQKGIKKPMYSIIKTDIKYVL